jgi:hypothetical protein
MPLLSFARLTRVVLVAIAFCVATLPSSAIAADSAAESASASSASGTAAAAAAAPPPDAAPAPPAPAVAADAPIVGHWCNAFPHVVIAIDAAGRVEMDGEGRHMCELLPGAREVRITEISIGLQASICSSWFSGHSRCLGSIYECPIQAETFESKIVNNSVSIQVRCTYRHIEGRVHLYKLKPGVDDKGRADPQQMQVRPREHT